MGGAGGAIIIADWMVSPTSVLFLRSIFLIIFSFPRLLPGGGDAPGTMALLIFFALAAAAVVVVTTGGSSKLAPQLDEISFKAQLSYVLIIIMDEELLSVLLVFEW